MQKNRFQAGVALGVILALGATGCGLGSTATTQATAVAKVPELQPGQQVSIVFESYNFGQAGAWTDTFTELIAKFQQTHPNIKVTAQKPQGNSPNPATDTVSSVQSQTAAGHPPDVAQLGFSDLDFTVRQLGAKPLDDLVGKDTVQANFTGTAHSYAPTARTLGDWDGKTYGVPFVFSTPVLYYNASLFHLAGLDPARPPTTWDEVRTAADAIKKATGKGGVYLDCLTKEAKDWCFQSLVRSNGGHVIAADRKSLSYTDQPAVDVVKMAQSLVTTGAGPKLAQKQGYEAFARGDIGMILESSAVQATFVKGAKDKWELRSAPMPAFTGKPVVPTNSGASLYVFATDPAKLRAGWELIKFLTSEQAYTTIATKIGYLPLRSGLADDPAGLRVWVQQNPLVKPNLAQLKNMEPWVSFPGSSYLQIRDGMMEAVEEAVYQGADPQESLDAAKAQATPLLPGGGK